MQKIKMPPKTKRQAVGLHSYSKRMDRGVSGEEGKESKDERIITEEVGGLLTRGEAGARDFVADVAGAGGCPALKRNATMP